MKIIKLAVATMPIAWIVLASGCSDVHHFFGDTQTRQAVALERIADAMERAPPALLLAPDVEVEDIRRAHDFKKASRAAAIKTNAELMSEAAGLLGQACKQNPEVCR